MAPRRARFRRYLALGSAASLTWFLAPAALGWTARTASANGIGSPPDTTTTTSARPTPPPTGPAHTTTSTTRAAAPTPAPTGTGTSTSTSTSTSTTFPPALLAMANAVRRSPPNNTFRLLAALQPLRQLGFDAQQSAVIGMGQFPVAGPATFADDWLEPRPGPVPRLHQGDDIVAASGTPLRAPVDGVLRYDTGDPAGYGVAAIVTGSDGTAYLMAHLSATVTGLSTGTAVKQGQVVGFVGQTGDATGPHCHFEVHPRGGAAIDPKPILDRFVADAMAAVPSLIAAVQASKVAPTSVAVSVPVLQPFPGSDQGTLGVVTSRLPTTRAGAGSANPPYPLAAAGLAAIVAVILAWKASTGGGGGQDDALEASPVELSPTP